MISEGTLALLSACNFLFWGKQLAVRRGQLRMTIGCLRSIGEVWQRTARNVQEIQTIARHVLGPKTDTVAAAATAVRTPQSSGVPSSTFSEGLAKTSGGSSEADSDGPNTDMTNFDVAFTGSQSLDSLCSWFSPADLPMDMSWFTESQEL
jgi:hypothetical protein